MIDNRIMLLTQPACKDWKLGGNIIESKFIRVWEKIIPSHPLIEDLLDGHELGKCSCCNPKQRPLNDGLLISCHGCVFDLDEHENGTKPLNQELMLIPNDLLVSFVSEQDLVYLVIDQGKSFATKVDKSKQAISFNIKENYFKGIINKENFDAIISDILCLILILRLSKMSTKAHNAAIEKAKRIIRRYKKY
jgi:hypothetical protein